MKKQNCLKRVAAMAMSVLVTLQFASVQVFATTSRDTGLTRTFDIQTNDYRSSSRNTGDSYSESKWEGVTPYGPLFGEMVDSGRSTRPMGSGNGGSSDWLTGYLVLDGNAFGRDGTYGIPRYDGLASIGIVRVNNKDTRYDDFSTWRDDLSKAFEDYNGNVGYGERGWGNNNVNQSTTLVVWDGYRRVPATDGTGDYISRVENVSARFTRARQKFVNYVKDAVKKGAKVDGYITVAEGVRNLYEPTYTKYRNGRHQVIKVPQIKITGLTYDVTIEHKNAPKNAGIKDVVPVRIGEKFNLPTVEGYYTIWQDEDGNPIEESIVVDRNRKLKATWFNPNNDTDTDEDGLKDEQEGLIGTDPNKVDTDEDGLSDYIEVVMLGTDPLSAERDESGKTDAEKDTDGDGITNLKELELGTDPGLTDTDADGLSDGDEVNRGTNPINYDTDGDGASDGAEVEIGTNPLVADASFDVTKQSDYEDTVKAKVEIQLEGRG